MEIQRPTLPLLLDLVSSPSYSLPKSSTRKKQQIIKTQSIPSSLRATTSRNFPTSTKESHSPNPPNSSKKLFINTARSLSKHEAQSHRKKGSQEFYFPGSQSPPKQLPKLYSVSQYNLYSQKLLNVKEKYKRFYNNSGNEGYNEQDNTEEGDLKDLIREADKLFSETYSVKYFGVKDNELGIVSKRVPMAKVEKKDKDEKGLNTLNLIRDHSLGYVERNNGNNQRSHSINNFTSPLKRDKSVKDEAQLLSNLNTEYVVTQYFAPKKLETIKRKEEKLGKKSKSAVHWGLQFTGSEQEITPEIINENEGDIEEMQRIWQKIKPENQKFSYTADFERKLMSVEKNKRALLRNVQVEKVWETRPHKDELDVPEKFRTDEVKKVMAGTTKYSYSKLLNTMYSKERPETVLVENTEKMERILAMREVRKKETRPLTDEPKIPQMNGNGRYIVRIQYPKENEMFNRFMKIRTTVDSRGNGLQG